MKEKTKRNLAVAMIVFASIFIIAVIILPTLNTSRCGKHHRRLGCASNLKQIGLGLEMYSNDHDGFYPDKSGAAGLEQLRSLDYITDYKIYVCRNTTDVPGEGIEPLTEANVSYCFRGRMRRADAADSAVCWDRPSNHKKFGNVLYIDGHVTGIAGANWMEEVK